MSDEIILNLVTAAAVRTPGAAAVLDLVRAPLSYAQLLGQVTQTSTWLRTQGIRSTDTVALSLTNGPEAATSFLAVASAAICAPLNPLYQLAEYRFYLEDLGARALIVGDDSSSPARAAADQLDIAVLQLLPSPERAGAFTLMGPGTGVAAPLEPPAGSDVALVLHTSGTTARPKQVPLSHRNLITSAQNVQRTLQLTAGDRCLNIMPLFHIHGLVAALLASLAAGGQVVCTAGFDAPRFFTWLEAARPTWYTAVPTMHQAILTQANLRHYRTEGKGSGLRFIRSSSAALPPQVYAGLESTFGVPVVEAYGMTEAAHQMTSNPLPPLVRKPGSVGLAAGPEVAIMGEIDERMLAPYERGEVVIRGANVMQGYGNNSAANASAFAAGWFRTGDQGYLDEDGYLTITGRIKELINRGGEKIAPREVDEVLLDHPGVAQALTFGLPDERLGEEVAAAVVLAAPGLTEDELRRFVAGRLAHFRTPKRIVFVPELPKGPTGKLQRVGLAQRLGLADPATPSMVAEQADAAPRNATEQAIAALWCEVLALASVGIGQRFLDLGGDSIQAMRLAARLQARFAVDLQLADLLDAPTVAAQAALVERSVGAEGSAAGEQKVAADAASVLLAELRRQQVEVRLDGEQVRFTAPTGVLTAELKQLLTVHKTGLRQLLAAEQRDAGIARPIPALPRPGRFPLSFAQQRLWFLNQLEPASPAYQIDSAHRLRGALDATAVKLALEAIVQRHEVLRTVISLHEDGEARQLVRQEASLSVTLTDLSGLPPAEREAAALRLVLEEAARTFDLAHDHMVRGRLLRLAEDDHILMVTLHHIATDDWSMAIFWREFTAFYTRFVRHEPAPMPALPIQYADFAVWQRQWLSGKELAQQLDYWRRALAELPPLELPGDSARPAVLSQRGAVHRFVVSPQLSAALRQLAQQVGVTPYMVHLAACQVVLYRHSGQPVFGVGAPVANRNLVELEPLIGFFVNTLIMRADLRGNPTVRNLLQQVRQTTLDAYAHQDLPFEKLVEELHPVRARNRQPLIQFLCQWLADAEPELILPGLQTEPITVDNGTARFDLTLTLREREDGLHGKFTFSTDLFRAGTVARLSEHYMTLLAAMVADPDCPIDRLPLLTPAEHKQVTATPNATATPYPRDACLHQVFEQQALQRPTATALIFGEQRVSYGELNHQANRIAHLLRDLGVTPDAPVGLCLRRTPQVIVALLAVLKAGGAYFPLDPGTPASRLAFLVEDAGASLLITDAALMPTLPTTSARILLFDALSEGWAEADDANLPCVNTAGDLAYLMYTSGSTGQPKGVEVPHRAVLRLVHGVEYVTLGPGETLLQLAPLTFDAATFELWGALLHGSPLVLAPEGLPDYMELEALLVRHHVSLLWLTAGLFNSIIEQRPQMLRTVRQVITGGQALSVHYVRLALAKLPQTVIVNGYGPTENTTFTCCYPIPRALPDNLTSIPIGRPVPNTQVYLLDEHLVPVPVGVVGELYAGGDGLARGYRQRPALTAELFVSHPWQPGERLYRTGDLARWRLDGLVEFVGRRDRQIKVRGYRIEPVEVEHVLRQHPAVRDAVVVAQPHGTTQRLIACLAIDSELPPNVEQLRFHLAATLPDYMRPAGYVFVSEIPLSPNGKVDEAALLAQARQTVVTQVTSSAPRDALDQQLVRIWERVLGVTPVGVHDDFFDLGGHSLLAVKLLDQVARVTGRRLPLTILFETPTVAALARALHDPHWAPTWSSLTPIHAGGARLPIFLVPPAAASALRFRPLATHLGPDQPVYAFHPVGLDDGRAPHTSVEQMAAHYLAELQRFLPEGPYLLGGMCFGANVALEMACQLEAIGASVLGLFVLDAGSPANGPSWSRLPPRRGLEHYWVQIKMLAAKRSLSAGTRKAIYVRYRRYVARFRTRFFPQDPHGQQIHRAHLDAQHAFCARPLHAPVILLQSEQYWSSPGCREKWSLLAQGVQDFRFVPGTTHRDLLLTEPYLGQLAGLIRATLDRIAADGARGEGSG